MGVATGGRGEGGEERESWRGDEEEVITEEEVESTRVSLGIGDAG
jgi:hypothetical protein